ncbi:uncharacterized protein DNG_09291 [Cephalotrichum gorgonifer]|uniref:Uncharacterized protein n=1 Tax=Cephalotrichum gorgonifer TaxID=2041049 RepID=A0AAE8SZ58_9PEZI|nr:uncharacterized protein DNG_09291 [Cephalotrichum gorgonifer]
MRLHKHRNLRPYSLTVSTLQHSPRADTRFATAEPPLGATCTTYLPREARGPESKRYLYAARNGLSRAATDELRTYTPPRTKIWDPDDWSSEGGWKKGLREVSSGNWHYHSPSTPIPALLRCQTVEEARRIWGELDAEAAKNTWAPVMLSLLASDTRQACLFLQASFPLSQPPLYALSDSIAHIYTYIETIPMLQRKPIADHLCDAVIYLLREHPARQKILGTRDIFKLQKVICPKRLVELYDELGRAEVHLSSYTLMHIASSLSREPGLKRRALEVMAVGLARIEDQPCDSEQAELRRRRWASVFTTILTSTPLSMTSHDVISPHEIWDFAIQNGITPNTIQLTALVQSLCAMGHIDSAWQAFDMFIQRGMPVDLKLSSTLLQGSKLSGSVPHILRALALIAEAQEVDARVGNNILHLVLSLAISEQSKGILPSFPLMAKIYSRMFASEPLDAIIPERLRGVVADDAALEDMILVPGFVSSLDKMFSGQRESLLQPTPVTLEIMVLSWICSLKREFKSPALTAFYGHYRGMLQERHPVAAEMVKTRNSIIHDMIIKAMSSSPAHLRAALEVISDMLHDNDHAPEESSNPPSDPASSASASSSPPDASRAADAKGGPVHPRPSEWTWNILLDAWMKHHKQDNVGRIVSLMKRHGVEPSLVTWNTILSRSARAKNTKLAVRSAQKIREGGFEPNEWTVRAFSRLVEKEMFLNEMQGKGADEGKGGEGRGKRRGL